MDLVSILRRIPAFADLERSLLQALASALVIDDYPDGHVFIRRGERGGAVFLVVEGEVDVLGAHDHPINRMRSGDLFGLVSLVDHASRSATCRARGPCRVGSLPSTAVALLFHQAAPIACAFQKALGSQLARDFRQLDQRLRGLADG